MPIKYKFPKTTLAASLDATKIWLYEEPSCKFPAQNFEEFNYKNPPKCKKQW